VVEALRHVIGKGNGTRFFDSSKDKPTQVSDCPRGGSGVRKCMLEAS